MISTLTKNNTPVNWLDIGCGNGGLIRYGQNNSKHSIFGFDTGYGAILSERQGLDIITEEEFNYDQNKYDIITAIELIEHVENPKELLISIVRLLKPGGYFIFTTGNTDPFSNNLCKWRYFIPEIHISLFNERSISELFHRAGLHYRKLERIEREGWIKIYRYKLLKNIGVKRNHWIFNFIPWRLLFSLLDSKYRLCWGIGQKINNQDSKN